MLLLVLGLALFLGIHSLSIVSPGAREALVERLGKGAFRGLYSVVSIVGFGLLVYGYGQARLSAPLVYLPPTPLRHAALLVMLPVFPLLAAAYRPSWIKAKVKHPMLAAIKIWALAHLMANGTLADLLLFGSFLVWAVADRISVKRRGAPTPEGGPVANDIQAVVLGLGAYAAFLFGVHHWLIGVPLIPGF